MSTTIKVKPEDVLTVQQAAKILRRPKVTLYRWVEKGRISCIRFGGVIFILREELERFSNEIANDGGKTENPTGD